MAKNELLQELQKETDRGVILLGTSILDEASKQTLDAFLRGSKRHKKLLFGYNGPLGNFSSRVSMMYSLNLLSKEDFDNISHLRKIRNELSHSYDIHSFEHPDIKKMINKLKYDNTTTLRDKVLENIIGSYFAIVESQVKMEAIKDMLQTYKKYVTLSQPPHPPSSQTGG